MHLFTEISILIRPNYTFLHDALMTHQSVVEGLLCDLCVCVYVRVVLRTLLADTV